MTPRIGLQQIDTVSADTRVRDYDELAPPAQDQLVELVDGDAATATVETVPGLEADEAVKFTDYYQVSVCR
jgi:hypothetical protein